MNLRVQQGSVAVANVVPVAIIREEKKKDKKFPR